MGQGKRKSLNNTYVGFRYFGLQKCDRSCECLEICRSMLIGAAHLARSMLFLQSEEPAERERERQKQEKKRDKIILKSHKHSTSLLSGINFQLLKCILLALARDREGERVSIHINL
jgi:hypothetical protein